MTSILRCNCIHEFQDKRYGYKMRVMNSMLADGMHKCTVCGTEKGGSYGKKGKKK